MNLNGSAERCTYTPSTEVYCQSLAGEAVLLDVATGVYFGLDEVGSRIWELLNEGRSLAGIADTLAGEYDAEPSALERDTRAFLDTLVAKGLVLSRWDRT